MGWTTFRSEGGLLPPDVLVDVLKGEYGGQTPRDFGLAGSTVTEDINAAWGEARTHWASFQMARRRLDPGESATPITREWMGRFLRVLGFRLIYQDRAARTEDGQTYAISHRLESATGLPVHVVSVDAPLTQRQRGVMRLSPYATVQEYLNKTEYLWGLVSNGERLWLLRNSTRTARPTYLEWDVATMMETEKYEDFVAFFRLCHVSRWPRTVEDGPTAWLERYVQAAVNQGGRIRDKLRDGVEQALTILGRAFLSHPANADLRTAVRDGILTASQYYQELLRLIYRVLFLMVAEDRQMVIPADDGTTLAIYQQAFSLDRLRRQAGAPPHLITPDLHDLWLGVLETFELFAYHDQPALLPIPALNGDLFGPEAMPHLETAQVENTDLLAAFRALAWFSHEGMLRRVNYAALDVEELGSVYESLLDFAPVFTPEGNRVSFHLVTGTERKSTGSYYTQPDLVQSLIHSTLAPVVRDRLRTVPSGQAEEPLLSLAICDPACGSGHFLLAAARYVARELARIRTQEAEPPSAIYHQALRDVIERCLYGVDKNPLAVDLCKVALWIEGHQPGHPLSFLDHRIRCGDSLIGVVDLTVLQPGIPGDAYQPKTGDVKAVAQALKRANQEEREGQQRWDEIWDAAALPRDAHDTLVASYHQIDILPTHQPEQVQHKKRQYQAWREKGTPWHALWTQANLWAAPFFARFSPATQSQIPTSRHVFTLGQGQAVPETVQHYANTLAARHNFFHWPLEFPEIFAQGGFDVMLGNPPWEKQVFREEEFFRASAPHIAQATNQIMRKSLIERLVEENPSLYHKYQEAQRSLEGTKLFTRNTKRFLLTGNGQQNTSALFAELAYTVVRDQGLVGLVVPTGIATDYTYRHFFGEVVRQKRLVSLYDFENREALFPGVHRSYKFCLLTLSRQPVTRARFGFFLTHPDQLGDALRTFTLSPEDLQRVNPNTRTCPVFRTRQDAELTRKIYTRIPVLINERTGENLWGMKFRQGLFNMSTDSGLFSSEPGPHRVPLYEAKLLHQFDHRWATYDGSASRDVTITEKNDPAFRITPRYWVEEAEVAARVPADWPYRWFVSYRRIVRATDVRTALITVVPWSGLGDTSPLLMTGNDTLKVPLLVGNMNSLIFDYCTRQKVGGIHMDFFLVSQLPILPPSGYRSEDIAFIMPRVLELLYTAWDLAPFARDMGYEGPPFPWNPERRAQVRAELDAYYAHLYGLTRDELRYIVDPQDVMGPTFPGETFRVLKKNEMQEYGEFRTRRLVLTAYDQVAPHQADQSRTTG